MPIRFPTNTAEQIENIIEQIGRDVTFYVREASSGCSDCGINEITGKPLDPFCTTCSGLYWIPIYSGAVRTCHVTWKDADDAVWGTGGKYFLGDCKVKLVYSPDNYVIVNNTDYMVVDDKQLTVNKIVLLGAPEVNRILIHAEEKENDDE